METIGYLLAGLTTTWLWNTKIRFFLFTDENDEGTHIKYRNAFSDWMMNSRPFNCATCMAAWIGIILCIIFCNPIYISLPLFYYFLNKTL